MSKAGPQDGGRPGVGGDGFVPLPRPSPLWTNLPGRVALRETPSGVVIASTRRPMVIMVVVLSILAAAVMAAVIAVRPGKDVIVLASLAMAGMAGIPSLVLVAQWRQLGAERPILIEHLYEGMIELSRRSVRIPTRQIAAIQSVSGWVNRPNTDDVLYVSQLLAIVNDDTVRRRVLVASVPHELPGESRRLASRLAGHLGVPHEHIQVRVRGGVLWDDLFSAPDVRSGSNAARA